MALEDPFFSVKEYAVAFSVIIYGLSGVRVRFGLGLGLLAERQCLQ